MCGSRLFVVYCCIVCNRFHPERCPLYKARGDLRGYGGRRAMVEFKQRTCNTKQLLVACAFRYIITALCPTRSPPPPPVTQGAGSVLPKNYDLSKNIRGEVYKLCPPPPPPPPRLAHQKNTRVWNGIPPPRTQTGGSTCAFGTHYAVVGDATFCHESNPAVYCSLLTCAKENTSKTSSTVRTSSGSSGRLQSPGSPA